MAVIIHLPRKQGFHLIDTAEIEEMKAAECPHWTHRHFASDFTRGNRPYAGFDLCIVLFVTLLFL